MLTKDVRFDGFTAEDWSRLLSLWKGAPEAASDVKRGGLLVLHSGGHIRKMLHTARGRIEKEGAVWPTPLAVLAAQHEARWVLAAPVGGLERIAERFGARARQEDDLTAQVRSMVSILKDLVAEGTLDLWPNRLDRLSLPSRPLFDNTFEAVYPAGHVILIALFHQGELFTSLALERSQGGISRIAGPDELRRRLSFLSGDFRRDYRFALAAAEESFGPVALGCFTDLDIFRTLQNEKSWAGWLRALAVRDVIVTPMNGSLVGPIAADAAVWASIAANSLGRRWDLLGLMLSLWRRWR